MTTAAITVAGQEKAIFIAKKFMKKLPIGPLTPKIYNRKNPTTVGGNTIGSVKIPSSIIFAVSFFILKRPQATIKPTKKVIKIDTLAVFIEMKIGDQSVMSKLLKKLVIQMNKLILNYYFLTLLVIQMNNI
jgi:hypothetical protein